MMLHLESIPKPDDTADALGMAIAHCHCSRSRLMGHAGEVVTPAAVGADACIRPRVDASIDPLQPL